MSALMIKGGGGKYRRADKSEVLLAAAAYMVQETRGAAVGDPSAMRSFLRTALAGQDAEHFAVVTLDNRHRVLGFDVLFRGTIDKATVFPREVVRLAIERNAAAVVFAHNHPSGVVEPSQADELITRRLKEALALIDVRTLDHFIVTKGGDYSFSEHGLL